MNDFHREWDAAGLAPAGELSEADRSALVALLGGKWGGRWRELVTKCAANPFYLDGEGRRLGRLTVRQFAKLSDKELGSISDYRPGRPVRTAAERQMDYMAGLVDSACEGGTGYIEEILGLTPPPPTRRPEDRIRPMVEAIGTACAVNVATHFNKAQVAAIDLLRGKFDPDDVAAFAKRFHEFCPWAAKEGRAWPSVKELVTHIRKLREQPTTTTRYTQDAY